MTERLHKPLELGYRYFKSEMHKVEISDLTCELCLEKVPNIEYLKTHLSTNHLKQLDSLNSIIPYKCDDSNFKCVHCSVEFVSFFNLTKHMNIHYPRHVCDHCGKGFVTMAKFHCHKLSHTIGTFPCVKCDASFVTKSRLNNHVKRNHSLNTNLFRCPHCHDRFGSYRDRQRHIIEIHDITVDYKCPLCPAVFKMGNYVTKHITRVHVQKKSHSCTDCAASFVTAKELQDHMIKHTGEKTFQCNFCVKAYARRKTLIEHLRIHYNDRRFVCSHCNKAFIQNCSLKQHIRVHHPA